MIFLLKIIFSSSRSGFNYKKIHRFRKGQEVNTAAESICTHYSNLSGWPDIFLGSETLKKQGPKYGVQKAGCKKQGHCYSKREEAAALFSFLNNNDPVFCTLLFASHIFDLIFFRVTNRPMFSKQE